MQFMLGLQWWSIDPRYLLLCQSEFESHQLIVQKDKIDQRSYLKESFYKNTIPLLTVSRAHWLFYRQANEMGRCQLKVVELITESWVALNSSPLIPNITTFFATSIASSLIFLYRLANRLISATSRMTIFVGTPRFEPGVAWCDAVYAWAAVVFYWSALPSALPIRVWIPLTAKSSKQYKKTK